MFRATKKKKKVAGNRPIRRSDDSDEDQSGPIAIKPINKQSDLEDDTDGGGETNVALLREKQKQKKSKKLRIGSKDLSTSRTAVKSGGSAKSKKRQRIGFGGSAVSNENNYDEGDEGGTQALSLYDTDALTQLKAEQAQWKNPDEEAREVSKEKIVQNRTPLTENNDIEHHGTTTKFDVSEDYIPLDGRAQQNETILAGDEALELATRPESGTKLDETKIPVDKESTKGETNTEREESDDLWQDRVSQRAGIQIPKTQRQVSSRKDSSTSQSPHLALQELRQQFTDAQEALENQLNDANSAVKRRQVDIKHTEETEIQQHLETVEKYGKAIEFYQGWRAMAITHVAALRDLDDKLGKIHTLLVDMFAKTAGIYRNRVAHEADDLFASLKDSNIFDRVVGRQPDPSIFISQDSVVEVDEFGRSVKSQQALSREKRAHERELINRKRREGEKNLNSTLGIDQDDWMTQNEVDDLKEQKSALNEALRFALSQIKTDFADISVLAVLFSDWMQHNFHEYKECYAGLSFADLASVLLRSDLYDAVLVEDKSKLENLGFSGDEVVMKLLDRDAATRLDEKSVILLLSDLVKKQAFGFASKSVSILLTTVIKKALCSTSSDTVFQKMVQEPLVMEMKRCLDELSLPVLSTEASASIGKDLTELQIEAIERQFRHVEAAVESIILWDRAVGLKCIGGHVLDFLMSTFLTSISSVRSMGEMRKMERLCSLARDSFSKVWSDIQTSSWLQNADWLVQENTLQAAASVYLE